MNEKNAILTIPAHYHTILCPKVRGADGEVPGELVADGGDVVQLQGVALSGHFQAVGVGDGEDAALVGVDALGLNAVQLEEEAVGSVAVEGQGGGPIVAGYSGNLRRLGRPAAGLCAQIRSADGKVAGELVADGGDVVQLQGVALGGHL